MRKIKIYKIIGLLIIFLALFFGFSFYMKNKYIESYNDGVSLLKKGNCIDAIECFNDIPDYINYRDIRELLNKYGVSLCPYCGSILE